MKYCLLNWMIKVSTANAVLYSRLMGTFFLFGLIAFFSISSPVQAQEATAALCADGLDNDGDGFTDVIDPECVLGGFVETMNCELDAYLVQDGTSNWSTINLVSGTFVEVPDNITAGINAIGYNVKDNRIWGVSGNRLVISTRSPAGVWTSTIATGPLPIGTPFTGDVNIDGELHAVTGGPGTRTVFVFDLDPASSTYLDQIRTYTVNNAVNLPDWAFNPVDGFLYGVGANGQLYQYDSITGARVNLGPSGAPAGAYGAMYTSLNGILFAANNTTGAIYRLNLSQDPGTDYDETLTSLFSTGPSSSSNDGARCQFAPVTLDFGDSPNSYGTLFSNNGPVHGILGHDPLDDSAEITLGTTVTPEANGAPGSAANADLDDSLLPLGQYEPLGGLTCTGMNGTYTTLENEYCAVVNVTNNGPIAAQLVGWLDFTVDGTFTDNIEERSLPDLGGNGTGMLVADSSGAVADNTFVSGNILPGFNGDVVLVWRGLGDVDEQRPDPTYLRVRLTTEDGAITPNAANFFSDASPSPNGPARDGEVEDHLVTLDTLPVTLSHFDSSRSSNYIEFVWGTSSELFNVGFQLWGLDGVDGQWEKLHNWLIRSGSGNAVEPQSYTKRVRIPTSIDQLVSVGISSVDSDGSEHYYGPFELGVSYGELGDLAPIAWDDVRAELDTRMAAQGYTKSGVNGYRKASSTSTLALSSTDNESVIEFRVSTPGVYRITGSELPQEWHSVPKGELAVLDYQGNGVVRHVQAKGQGSGSTRALGAAGSIYFYSEGVNETQRLYSEAKVYRLVLDSARALNAPIQSKQGVTSGFSDSYREVSVVEEDESYIFHSAVDDPWLDEVVIGFSDKLRVRRQPVPVEADLLIDDSATLLLGLGRSSALGAIDNDGDGVQDAEHIVTGTVTDADGVKVKLDPVSAVGSGRWDLALPIPAGTLLGDANGIVHSGAFFNAGEGYAFSEVHIDSIGLEYSRPYVSKAGEDHLLFRGPDTGELGYSVTVPDTGWPWVFASDGSNLVRIGLESQRRVTDSAGVKWREVTFSRLLGSELSPLSIHYWVSGRNGFYGVEDLVAKQIESQASILAQAQGSDYVMVSHPMFMGPDQAGVDPLSTYAEFKQGQGYTVSMINYLDIVDSFGGGQVGPWGLTHYLSELKLQSPLLRYVLLVGSSVYDHSDKLGTGALTFIPGHYVPGSHSDYTVSDVPYISNGDGGLFAHIGRWPVRELSELQVIVDKSMQWGSAAHHQGEALLIAEHTVVGEEIDFAQALDGVAEVLPATYSHHKVYVDALLAADPDLSLTQALALAKGQIIDALNNGPEVVVYNGHASTGQLSNQNLFKHSDVDEVTTAGAEIWVPLSCYVTYYESTTVNTLAHQLLFTGNAVAITGAMLLSNQAENIQMGQSILDSTFNQGQSIGEAVNQAKTIQNNPNLTHNWATLGDPSAKF